MILIGIIGAGKIASKFADTVLQMNDSGIQNIKLYAISSRSEEKAKQFATEHKIEKYFTSYEKMLLDKNINLVYVATPHSHHFAHVKLCLENNKNVLCEKAFTANAIQAKELVKLAKEKKLLLSEAIWTRYQPMRKIIFDTVYSGIVGKPKMITANLSYNIIDVERIIKPCLAGGALLDIGIYPLNFVKMIFGLPDSVYAVCQKTNTLVDENDSITLFFNKENQMAVLCSSTSSISDRYGMIHCENGFIQVENINNPQKISVFDNKYKLIKGILCPKQLTGYEYEIIEVSEAIESGKTECQSMPLSETVYMMELMDEIRNQLKIKYPFEN